MGGPGTVVLEQRVLEAHGKVDGRKNKVKWKGVIGIPLKDALKPYTRNNRASPVSIGRAFWDIWRKECVIADLSREAVVVRVMNSFKSIRSRMLGGRSEKAAFEGKEVE